MATNYIGNDDAYAGGGYGYGGGFGGGAIGMVLLVVLVLWVLFRDGHGNRGFDGFGGFGGRGCECESNCEQDKFIGNKFDQVISKECMIEKEILVDGGKTRALIEANYIQDLRDKISEQNSTIQTMKSEAFTAGQIATVRAENNAIMHELERIQCKMLVKPELFGCASTPELVKVGRDFDDFRPRRGRCDFADVV